MSILNALMHISSAIAQHPDPQRKEEFNKQFNAVNERMAAELWLLFQAIDDDSSREEDA